MAAQAARTQAKAPPAMAARAPAVQATTEPLQTESPRLLASLSAIPAAPPVQRMCSACAEQDKEEMPVQPRLEVGPVGDRYEREADSIAGRVMAMRDGEASSAEAGVQRACSACSADDEPRARRLEADEDEMKKVRPSRDGSGETIAASDNQLTSGGSPLPAETRSFFEDRMGRDLGDVRVHQGGGAHALNASIAARAFTYKNHVWLGANENAGPSFTMAHELAHVMQQTAPGPIGPQARRAQRRASAAHPAIRRRDKPFWLPAGTPAGRPTLGLHTKMHNAALGAIRKRNPSVMSEVPIPGGNRSGVGPDKCGFADLYTAKVVGKGSVMVPGLEEVPKAVPAPASGAATPAPPVAPSLSDLNNFSITHSLTSCKDRIGTAMQQGTGKGTVPHDARRGPKIVGGKLIMLDAPEDILIGEMKPAHDPDYRDKGVKQLDSYIQGVNNTAVAVNNVAKAIGVNSTWSPNAKDIGASLTTPEGWDADGDLTTDWKIKSIKIRSYEPRKARPKGTKKGGGSKAKDTMHGRPKSEPIRGRWMMAKDPDRSGIFVYFLAPNPDDLAKALGTSSTRTGFRTLAGKIDLIQKDLYTAPKPTKVGAVQPRRLAIPARPAPASVAPARVMRKEVKDHFKAAAWETKRTGSGLAQGAADTSLLGAYDDLASDALREEIVDQGAAVQWLRQKPETKGVSYSAVKPPSDAENDLELLKSTEFWTGPKAKPFGILREKFGNFFGTAFRKVSEFAEKVKAKFHGNDENKILGKGPKGTIMKAAAKVASVVLPRIAKPFLRAMYNTIIDCGIQGFEAKIKELIKGTFIEDVMQTAEEIQAKIHEVADDVETYFKKLIDDTIGPIEAEFKAFIDEAKLIGEVVSIINDLAKAARIGSCIAGLVAAPETVGIGAVVGCGAALADFILSKFGLSPVEYFIASLLSSCDMQNTIGKALAGVDFVKTLPERAGLAIVKKVKELLRNSGIPGTFAGKSFGQHASELFCDPGKGTFPKMGYEPSDCRDTGPFKASKTNDYEIPPDVKLFKKGDPIDDNEKKHMGRDGSEPSPPPDAPAATAPPSVPGEALGEKSATAVAPDTGGAWKVLKGEARTGRGVSLFHVLHPPKSMGSFGLGEFNNKKVACKYTLYVGASAGTYVVGPVDIEVELVRGFRQEEASKKAGRPVHHIVFKLLQKYTFERDDGQWVSVKAGEWVAQEGTPK